MFFHSGFPTTWHRPPRLYALYELSHDCFLYVNHDFQVVKKVKSLLSSKALTWVYEMRLPLALSLSKCIENSNAVNYTLQPDTARPDPVYYLSQGTRLAGSINCTEINVLGEMTGIEYISREASAEVKQLQHWAQFIAWVILEIQNEEIFDDEMVTRALLSDFVSVSTQLISNDMYMIASRIYRVLLEESDIGQASHKIGEIALQARNARSVNADLRPYKNIASLYHYSNSSP